MKTRSFGQVVHISMEHPTDQEVVDAIITKIKLRRRQRCVIYIREYCGEPEDLKRTSRDAVGTRYGAASKRHEGFFFSTELSHDVVSISY